MTDVTASQGRPFVFALSMAVIQMALVCPVATDAFLRPKADFIGTFKSRVTIDADYIVDQAHKHPNPPNKDGELHAAGRSEQIGPLTVAEIENAAEALEDKIHAAESTDQPLLLAGDGAPGPSTAASAPSSKVRPLSAFDATNPPHEFEIHPVTNIGGQSPLRRFIRSATSRPRMQSTHL